MSDNNQPEGLILRLPLDTIETGKTPDTSGNNQNAVVQGNPQIVEDEKFGKCMNFNGLNDAITVADNPTLRIQHYTVEVWICPNGKPANMWTGIIGKPRRNFNIWLNYNGFIYHRFSVPDNWDQGAPDTPGGSITWNNWSHVVITNDGTTARTYINGIKAAEGPTNGEPTIFNNQLIIGMNLDGGQGYYFKGKMAHISIYDHPLDDNTIIQNYEKDYRAQGECLKLHLPLDDIQNGKVMDTVRDGFTHVIEGNPAVVPDYIFGRCLSFDGEGDYIPLLGADSMGITDHSFTVSAWFNASDLTAVRERTILGDDNPHEGTHRCLHLVLRSKKAWMGFYHHDTGGTTELQTNKWYHIAFVYDKSELTQTIYIDGILDVRQGNRGAFLGTGVLNVGRWANSYYFKGLIAHLRIYDRVLSADEIINDMNTDRTPPDISQPNLMLHLPLDEIVNNRVTDASGHGFTPVVKGNPAIVPDDLFGSCLSFDGEGDYIPLIEADGMGITDHSFTVSTWVNALDLTAIRERTILGDDNPHEGTHRCLHLVLRSKKAWMGFYHHDTGGTTELQTNKWYHIAFVYDKSEMTQTIYIDGILDARQGNREPFQGTGVLNVGRWTNSYYFKGLMAHLRIYNRALTQGEVKDVRLKDQSTISAFKVEYPLEFILLDDNERNVLYISDDAGLNTFQVEIQNTSQQNIELLTTQNNTPPEENFHFQLRFKPKTFERNLDGTKEYVKSHLLPDQWAASDAEINTENGMVSIYLLYTGGNNDEPGRINAKEKQTFSFQYKSADGTGGARGTQVELVYNNLKYQSDTVNISGKTRIINVDIINQRGKKNIPLHVGIVGSNKILNDAPAGGAAGGTQSQITIRLANTLKRVPEEPERNRILFNTGNIDTERNTKFTLLFDDPVGDDWDLASENQLNSIAVPDSDFFEVDKSTQGRSPVFEITPKHSFLGPQDFIDIQLTGIYTTSPTGLANIYIKYEDIPGYWDGQFVLQVEKSPVVFSREKNVGIGTANPRAKLEVAGDIVTNVAKISDDPHSSDYAAFSHKDHGTSVGYALLQHKEGETYLNAPTGKNVNFRINNNTHMILKSSGNVGIGTTTPQAKLEVAGDIVTNVAKISDDPHGGNYAAFSHKDHGTSVGYALLQHKEGETYLNAPAAKKINFRINNQDKMVLASNGNVGIGTTNPQVKLEVAGDIAANCLSVTGKVKEKHTDNQFYDLVPRGTIVMWHGTEIPHGWALCDGQNGTPDLRGRFILAAGQGDGLTNRTLNDRGGDESVRLTTDQMPRHNHSIRSLVPGATPIEHFSLENHFQTTGKYYGSYEGDKFIRFDNGGNNEHPNMPPYYVLQYIMKL